MGNKSSTRKQSHFPGDAPGDSRPVSASVDVDEGVICTVVQLDGKEVAKRVFRSSTMNEFLIHQIDLRSEFDVNDYEVVIYKSNNEIVIPKPDEEFEEHIDTLYKIKIAAKGTGKTEQEKQGLCGDTGLLCTLLLPGGKKRVFGSLEMSEKEIGLEAIEMQWISCFTAFKSFWLKIIRITNQNLVLRYFYQTEYSETLWFEEIKKSEVAKYIMNVNQLSDNIDMILNLNVPPINIKKFLQFATLILCYTTQMLNILKNEDSFRDAQDHSEKKHLINGLETVCDTIIYVLDLMPRSYLISLKEIEKNIQDVITFVNDLNFTFDSADFEQLHFDERLIVYDVHILCAVLGLNNDFQRFLMGIEPEIWAHQDESYHIIKWIEYTNETMPQMDSISHELCLLGFTKQKASFVANSISDDLIHHESSLYWAVIYIENMFQCHPLLVECSNYPYNSHHENVFFTETVPVQHENIMASIEIMNVSDRNNQKIYTDIQAFIYTNTGKDSTILFHGTSHTHANSILTRGIQLTEGKSHQDFSHNYGFYLSYEFNEAKKWAENNIHPAVLVYSIPNELLLKNPHLDLIKNLEEWQKTVKYCRKGYVGDMPHKFSDNLFVDGNRCANPKPVRFSNAVPVQSCKRQLCIKDANFALNFNTQGQLLCVIFYNQL